MCVCLLAALAALSVLLEDAEELKLDLRLVVRRGDWDLSQASVVGACVHACVCRAHACVGRMVKGTGIHDTGIASILRTMTTCGLNAE